MQVQPPSTKLPRTLVPVCALKVRAVDFILRLDVPAPTSLVGDERTLGKGLAGAQDELGVGADGREAVVDGEVAAAERAEEVGDGGLGLGLGEDDVR